MKVLGKIFVLICCLFVGVLGIKMLSRGSLIMGSIITLITIFAVWGVFTPKKKSGD